MYAKELHNFSLITEKEYITIFSNINSLRQLNHDLLKDLKSENSSIGASFLRVVRYNSYLRNISSGKVYEQLRDLLQQL